MASTGASKYQLMDAREFLYPFSEDGQEARRVRLAAEASERVEAAGQPQEGLTAAGENPLMMPNGYMLHTSQQQQQQQLFPDLPGDVNNVPLMDMPPAAGMQAQFLDPALMQTGTTPLHMVPVPMAYGPGPVPAYQGPYYIQQQTPVRPLAATRRSHRSPPSRSDASSRASRKRRASSNDHGKASTESSSSSSEHPSKRRASSNEVQQDQVPSDEVQQGQTQDQELPRALMEHNKGAPVQVHAQEIVASTAQALAIDPLLANVQPIDEMPLQTVDEMSLQPVDEMSLQPVDELPLQPIDELSLGSSFEDYAGEALFDFSSFPEWSTEQTAQDAGDASLNESHLALRLASD
ncbi:hypothetical protein DE146DRAFT_761024 [Phaeosphaeria sp. MPI-PUGE-AT-0046c]|nr:hypothetical protein DE146DRAFT_761024 [Phaeosphaeria sp. MPI-PUGE-AT-0046c]